MKKIAAEGILTCLQDAIDSLKQGPVNYFFATIERLVDIE